MAKVIPVILSGGIGSRLWPLSREQHPKQFLSLSDGQNLLQKTFLRALSLPDVEEIITITNRDFLFNTKDSFSSLGIKNSIHQTYILEPFGRNTAPAVALAVAHALKRYPNESVVLFILPADHILKDIEAFGQCADQAIDLSNEKDAIVTFGIKPSAPKTGYGYIQAEGHQVLRFVEKPDQETAQKYLEDEGYFWNSGMFCFSPQTMMQEMKLHCPDVLSRVQYCLAQAAEIDGPQCSQIELDGNGFALIEDISIDYAVLEKSKKVAMVPCQVGWSDLGCWEEFGELNSSADESNNYIQGETELHGVENCIICANDRLVAGIGLKDLVIADTPDALLVSHRSQIQSVKHVVQALKERQHEAYQTYPTVYRPWGNYTVLQASEGFKIKRIEVKPGASLSLQMHYHRSEHWVVVSGQAKVINGEQILTLNVNESTYISVGNKHRLENLGANLLVLIEVQCGDYLGEDDIVRFDDDYGRSEKNVVVNP